MFIRAIMYWKNSGKQATTNSRAFLLRFGKTLYSIGDSSLLCRALWWDKVCHDMCHCKGLDTFTADWRIFMGEMQSFQ